MRKTIWPVVAAAMLAGCAGRAADGDIRTPAERTISISTADNAVNTDIRMTRDEYLARAALLAPREAVWAVVTDVFAEVGLPAPRLDDARWTATVENHVVRRRLGGQRLSRYLECGSGMTGAYADERRLYLNVTVQLQEGETADETTVVTRVTATAEQPSGVSGTMSCSSRGSLERTLANALQLEVLGG